MKRYKKENIGDDRMSNKSWLDVITNIVCVMRKVITTHSMHINQKLIQHNQSTVLAHKGELLRYIVYMIRRKSDGKVYIGITHRTLEQRVNSHRYDAMRKGVHHGGLAFAIRTAKEHGMCFSDAFEYVVLEYVFCDNDFIRTREKHWVDTFNSRYPNGFNIHPGGSSIGSIQNCKPITVSINGAEIKYPSRSLAIASSACSNVTPGAMYWRLKNWPVNEALGISRHLDARSFREVFIYQGSQCNSLAVASQDIGTPIATLRSRLHRAKKRKVKNYDLSIKTLQIPSKLSTIPLPHPFDDKHEDITSRRFSKLTGIPQTTISYRANNFALKMSGSEYTRGMLLAYLINGEDRTSYITVKLTDGFTYHVSINKLARMVAHIPRFQKFKLVQLKESTLRKRLQNLLRNNSKPTRVQIYEALALKYY